MSNALYPTRRVLWMPLGLAWKAPDAGAPRCCDTMTAALDFSCDVHADPFECPDGLIVYNEPFDEYGIVIHDGGASYLLIEHCPWCGTTLPPSRRDHWFAAMDALHVDADDVDAIPKKYLTREWRNEN